MSITMSVFTIQEQFERMPKLQRQLSFYGEEEEKDDDDASVVSALSTESTTMRSAASPPRFTKASAHTDCSICLDALDPLRNHCTTACGHVFCFTCIARSMTLKSTCPYCRAPLLPRETSRLTTEVPSAPRLVRTVSEVEIGPDPTPEDDDSERFMTSEEQNAFWEYEEEMREEWIRNGDDDYSPDSHRRREWSSRFP